MLHRLSQWHACHLIRSFHTAYTASNLFYLVFSSSVDRHAHDHYNRCVSNTMCRSIDFRWHHSFVEKSTSRATVCVCVCVCNKFSFRQFQSKLCPVFIAHSAVQCVLFCCLHGKSGKRKQKHNQLIHTSTTKHSKSVLYIQRVFNVSVRQSRWLIDV